MSGIYHPAWRDWYHLKHKEACRAVGTQFEDYIERVLSHHHDDYMNPDPMGRLGDGGCDGVAEMGTVLYACYGAKETTKNERYLSGKIASDFNRAYGNWAHLSRWKFVTNGPVGPLSIAQIVSLQREHSGTNGKRRIDVKLWRPDDVWKEVVYHFPMDTLDQIFPGAPGIVDVELSDLLPLLDHLGAADPTLDDDLTPLDEDKIEFNSLPELSRIELTEGSRLSARLERWFGMQGETELQDKKAARFRQLYREFKEVGSSSQEILERLYVAVGGDNFRLDSRRANSVFAITAFFFGKCHIFEKPPLGWSRPLAS